MISKRRQQGVAAGLIAIVIILVIVGMLATAVISRLGRQAGSSEQATVGLDRLADALEKYAATAGRLPCPADPALPTTSAHWGDEAVPSPNVGACQFPNGTVPWRTLGARAEDALDPWGTKISYRVFTGTNGVAGSLTQPDGVNLVQCDLAPATGATTAVSGVSGGLCVANADPTLRSTYYQNFYTGKGLTVNDMGAARTGIAFVLVSHGPTGQGGYTANGVPTAMPLGDELANTAATGPFTIKAFSNPGTEPGTAAHFDDRHFYRSLEELVSRTKLAARDWPEPVAPGEITFDQTTVNTAVGSTVTPGSSVGQVTVNFVGAVVTGSGSAGSDVSFGVVGGYGGIGVAGGGSALLQSSANEKLSMTVTGTPTKFGVTLNDFGIYSGNFYELVEFRFFLGGADLGTPRYALGCNIDGGLAAFEGDIGTAFDRIDITPYPAVDINTFMLTGITAILVTQVRTCDAAATSCVTSLATPGNTCTLF